MKITLRILSVILATLMLSLCFVACDGKKNASSLAFETPDGVVISIGADAAPIIEKLGAPTTVNESNSCGGFSGKDYVYTYKGFRVSTTPADGYQMICKVELLDDSLKTPEGLYIGMSRTDAEAAMKGFSSMSIVGNVSYISDSTMLNVTYRDECISSITYVDKGSLSVSYSAD